MRHYARVYISRSESIAERPESTQNVNEQRAQASVHLHRSRKWQSRIQISCDAHKAY